MVLLTCIFMISFRIQTNAEGGEKVKIYLDSQIVSGDTVKISVCIDGNIGFCGGFFALSYNENYLSYAFCVSGELLTDMCVTPSLSDSGKVYILLDSTRNFYSDGALIHLYFRIKDAGADMLKFDVLGADEISLVRIDGGEVLPMDCDFVGERLILNSLPRVVGFQSREDDIRIVCAGNEEYDILGLCVRVVYPESHKIEEFIYYGYAYKKLCGSEKSPSDYGAEYFFCSELKIEKETACLFVIPFGYDGEKAILGKEKTLLFYKGEYI